MAFKTAIPESTRAYIAGIFDGEGCVSSHKSRGYTNLSLYIGQKDLSLLEWIRDELGLGRIYSERDCARLQISKREEIREFVKLVYPYSRVKREQLKLGYLLAGLQGRTYRRLIGGYRGQSVADPVKVRRREELHVRIKELKSVS